MSQKDKLPNRRQKILDFIQDFMQDNGIPPTVRDIQKACEISSTSVVDYNLRLLDRDGFLNRRPEMARGIELLGTSGTHGVNTLKVPIVGSIAAGSPIPVFPNEVDSQNADFDFIEISAEVNRKYGTVFALEVKGTSMIDALIDDGDLVLVQPTPSVEQGEMAVAWIADKEEATLKKFYVEGDKVRLQPANSAMGPIYCQSENVEVRGKVVGVIRKY